MFTYYFHKFTLISTRVVNSNIMDISLGQELNSQEKFNTKEWQRNTVFSDSHCNSVQSFKEKYICRALFAHLVLKDTVSL